MLHADLAAAVERGVRDREGRTFRIGMARYRYLPSGFGGVASLGIRQIQTLSGNGEDFSKYLVKFTIE